MPMRSAFLQASILALMALGIMAEGVFSMELKERTGLILMKGKPLTLLGEELKVGGRAPEFEVIDTIMAPVKLSSFKGKILIIASVPSLDTQICDTETRRFNKEAANLGSDVEILTISMDLPFAQKRWCGASGVDKVHVLSDHREASFGASYGVLIKELRLLARAVFVVDKEGIIRYIQIVKETASEPNYDEVLKAVRKLTG